MIFEKLDKLDKYQETVREDAKKTYRRDIEDINKIVQIEVQNCLESQIFIILESINTSKLSIEQFSKLINSFNEIIKVYSSDNNFIKKIKSDFQEGINQ